MGQVLGAARPPRSRPQEGTDNEADPPTRHTAHTRCAVAGHGGNGHRRSPRSRLRMLRTMGGAGPPAIRATGDDPRRSTALRFSARARGSAASCLLPHGDYRRHGVRRSCSDRRHEAAAGAAPARREGACGGGHANRLARHGSSWATGSRIRPTSRRSSGAS